MPGWRMTNPHGVQWIAIWSWLPEVGLAWQSLESAWNQKIDKSWIWISKSWNLDGQILYLYLKILDLRIRIQDLDTQIQDLRIKSRIRVSKILDLDVQILDLPPKSLILLLKSRFGRPQPGFGRQIHY